MFKIGLCGAVNFKWAKETHRKFFSTYESLSWNGFIIGIDKRREIRIPSVGCGRLGEILISANGTRVHLELVCGERFLPCEINVKYFTKHRAIIAQNVPSSTCHVQR